MQVAQFQILRDFFNTNDNVTIFDVRSRVAPPKKRKVKTAKGRRHVVWDPYEIQPMLEKPKYELMRVGVPAANESDLDATYERKEVQETDFYIFKNTDVNVERNKDIPLYEAAYYCNETKHYLRVQKCHLKQGYTNAERGDKTQMWTIMDNGMPYWVDRHVFWKESQRESKQRYEKKHKK